MARKTGAPARNHDATVPTYLAGVGHYVGVITASDSTIYDPPILLLRCTVAGNVVLVYDQDDEADSTSYDTLALNVGDELGNRLIRQVRATGTSATVHGYQAQ